MLGTATRLQNARTISLSGAVSGSTSFNGSGNVTITTKQANIAILTATVTTPAAGNESLNVSTTIAYPSGFNANNSAIISLMSHNTVETSGGYATVGASGRSLEVVRGNHGLQAQLRTDGVLAQVFKLATAEASKTINIRVVLMKIS